jgi:uncharacterized membrane protein
MAKQRQPINKSQVANATSQVPQRQPISSVAQVQHATQHYSGPIPPPSILKGFDDLVPGAANRLITLAEEESKHRRELETRALDANISTQKRQLDIGGYQTKAVFRSDLVAQILGGIVTVFSMVAAIWSSLQGQTAVALILAAIPTAALIRSFFPKRSTGKPTKGSTT